jgi:ACS family tartrate transporter-like MFS transporter
VTPAEHAETAFAAAVLSKVTRRLIPFMFALYVVAYLDRINVGFAALEMRHALGFTDAVYGFGAGIFFLGYFLLEVPSNLILHRMGARVWMARIMITWGVISAAMMLVRGVASFYALRFLLGAAEAGFFPGMILYLTYWFPAAERARAVARFMTATAMAGVLGGPISGALLGLGGRGGLAGWQWLFLLEGLPAVVLGLVVLVYLTDRPEDATWLAPEERAWLAERMRRECEQLQARQHHHLLETLAHRRVWLLGLLYFALVSGLYGVSFWLPQIIQGFGGLGDLAVGVLSMLPYLAAAVGMVIVGARSDRRRERRWHLAASAFVGAAGLVASAGLASPALSLAALSLAALGVWSTLGPFWALSAGFASGSAAAGAIALVNSIGNLGGFVGPYLVGLVKEHTHSFAGGLVTLAGGLVLAGLIALGIGDGAEPPAS